MRQMSDATWEYINATFAPEDAALRAIREVGEALVPGMQVSAAEGQLLQLLVRLSGARRIVEIGTFVGYSTVCMARALPPGGEIISFEANPEHAAHARTHCADYPVRIVEGDALAMITSWAEAPHPNPLTREMDPPGSIARAQSPMGEESGALGAQRERILFDAVFIDAEKRRYVDYLDAVLPLLHEGGLIMADNTLLFGAMAGEPQRDNISQESITAMQQFNRRLADPEQFTGMMIPTPEGLTVGVKK